MPEKPDKNLTMKDLSIAVVTLDDIRIQLFRFTRLVDSNCCNESAEQFEFLLVMYLEKVNQLLEEMQKQILIARTVLGHPVGSKPQKPNCNKT